jgi:hypothetical protein
MNMNEELDSWRALWQTPPEAPSVADLRDRVRREARQRKVALVAPIAVTIIIGGWISSRAIASARWEDVALALETWLFIAVTWTGSLWLGRGTWRPATNTTRGFVDLSIRGCESVIAGLRFGAVLYLAQLAIILYWKLRFTSVSAEELIASWPVVAIGWLGVPLFFAGGVWLNRKKQAELRALLELRRQLTD